MSNAHIPLSRALAAVIHLTLLEKIDKGILQSQLQFAKKAFPTAADANGIYSNIVRGRPRAGDVQKLTVDNADALADALDESLVELIVAAKALMKKPEDFPHTLVALDKPLGGGTPGVKRKNT